MSQFDPRIVSAAIGAALGYVVSDEEIMRRFNETQQYIPNNNMLREQMLEILPRIVGNLPSVLNQTYAASNGNLVTGGDLKVVEKTKVVKSSLVLNKDSVCSICLEPLFSKEFKSYTCDNLAMHAIHEDCIDDMQKNTDGSVKSCKLCVTK